MANPAQYDSMTTCFGKTDINLIFAAGAAGILPTTAAGYTLFNQNVLLTSVKRAATTGIYDFFLKEPWLNLCTWTIGVIQASFSASGAVYADVTTDNVSTAAAPKVTATFYTAAGAPVNLAVGDVVYFELELRFKKAV